MQALGGLRSSLGADYGVHTDDSRGERAATRSRLSRNASEQQQRRRGLTGSQVRPSGCTAGYTLPEALVVLAIVGLVMTGVGPAVLKLDRSSRAEAAAVSLLNDVRLARMYAVSHQEDASVSVHEGCYAVTPTNLNRRFPVGVELDPLFGSATSLTFDSRGMLSDSNAVTYQLTGPEDTVWLLVSPAGRSWISKTEPYADMDEEEVSL